MLNRALGRNMHVPCHTIFLYGRGAVRMTRRATRCSKHPAIKSSVTQCGGLCFCRPIECCSHDVQYHACFIYYGVYWFYRLRLSEQLGVRIAFVFISVRACGSARHTYCCPVSHHSACGLCFAFIQCCSHRHGAAVHKPNFDWQQLR